MKKQLLTLSIAFICLNNVTAQAPTMVSDFIVGATGTSPINQTNINGTLFYSADVAGLELFKSDGTEAGTILVKDIYTGFGNASSPSFLTDVNGIVYFTADDGTNGVELWKSNGTDAGTVMVKDIEPGSGDSDPVSLFNFNGTLFFNGPAGLWKSDGTDAGTIFLDSINPNNFINYNNTLYFRSYNLIHGIGLWKSDGTVGGAVLVKSGLSIAPLSTDPNLTNPFINMNGTLYFQADDGVNGKELWKSDGTEAGTVMVKDISAGATGSSPNFLCNVNGTLFFQTGNSLWKSDGTDAGTVLVKNITFGLQYLTNLNGTLIFRADDGVIGAELWKSDGTTSGTVVVKDIRPTIAASTPLFFTNFNNALYFSANDGTNGTELWKTDGTEAGTVIVEDIRVGTSGSSPASFAVVNNTLFFSASDGSALHGRELWKLESGAIGLTSLTANNNFKIFPNPSSGKFTINTNSTLSKIEVYNVIGEKILEQENGNEIDLSTSPKGIYLVKMNEGTKAVTKRIVIQ